MRLGVNVPNFGPGTNPDVPRRPQPALMPRIALRLTRAPVAHPETAWQALATVAERWNQQESKDIDPERS